MKLKRFLLRYFPPGVILEYESKGDMKSKDIDLLDLSPDTDLDALATVIIRQEPLISESRKPQLRRLLESTPHAQRRNSRCVLGVFIIARVD